MLWLSVRARWRRALVPCLAVALLIGIAGGFVLAAISAARHVASAYQPLIDEIDPPDLVVTVGCGGEQSRITGCHWHGRPPVAPPAATCAPNSCHQLLWVVVPGNSGVGSALT